MGGGVWSRGRHLQPPVTTAPGHHHPRRPKRGPRASLALKSCWAGACEPARASSRIPCASPLSSSRGREHDSPAQGARPQKAREGERGACPRPGPAPRDHPGLGFQGFLKKSSGASTLRSPHLDSTNTHSETRDFRKQRVSESNAHAGAQRRTPLASLPELSAPCPPGLSREWCRPGFPAGSPQGSPLARPGRPRVLGRRQVPLPRTQRPLLAAPDTGLGRDLAGRRGHCPTSWVLLDWGRGMPLTCLSHLRFLYLEVGPKALRRSDSGDGPLWPGDNGR